jgi:hypothetical protein
MASAALLLLLRLVDGVAYVDGGEVDDHLQCGSNDY